VTAPGAVIKDPIRRTYGVAVFAGLVAVSGYAYTYIAGNSLVTDFGTRSVVLIALLGVAVVLLLSRSRWILPPLVIFLSAPIAYMGAVALIRWEPVVYLPAAVRWATYFLLCVYVYNSDRPYDVAKTLVTVLGWILVSTAFADVVIGRGLDINNAFRVGGSVGSPIGFAGAMFVTGLGALFFWSREHRLRYLLLAVGAVAATLLTGTRSIGLGMLAFYPAYLVLIRRMTFGRMMYGALLFVMAMIIGMVLALASPLGQRLTFDSIADDSSSYFRLRILGAVLNDFRGVNLVAGNGLGSFSRWFESLTGLPAISPHFEIVWLIVEGGLVGTMLYILVLAATTVILWRKVRNHLLERDEFWLVMFLLTAQQTVLQFANPSYFYQIMIPMFAMVGAVLSKADSLAKARIKKQVMVERESEQYRAHSRYDK
jgi:hypothetical protein